MPFASQSILSSADTNPTATTKGLELAQEVLANFGRLRLCVTGGSMLPAVLPGDVLSFERRVVSELAPGQVVLARSQGRLVVHRLVCNGPRVVLTQGDAMARADAPLAPDDVLGVMVHQQRGARELAHAQRSSHMRPRLARWLLRRSSLAHRICLRLPRLAGLMG